MEESRPPSGGERRQLVHTVSAPQALRAGSAAPGLPHARSAAARLEGAPSLTPSDSGHGEKARKPYTITKQRERWTDAEHALFLEALREHGRAWRRIEEHIGTKTAVQIRSHAQKFFAKLEREQASGNKSTELPADLTIPPPRPKRKPARPYPKKSEPEASGTGAAGAGNHGRSHYPSATDRAGNGSGSAGLQRHGANHGSQHLTCSVASPANRPAPSPSPGAHGLGTQAFMGGVGGGPMAPYMQHGGPVWAHHGMHHGGVDVGVAAVAAAASAAAAAAAAAVVATADEATQAQLQADPPQGFPFFGMPPSALAHFASQMQASPQLAGLAAVQQRAQLLQAQRQQQHLPHHGGGGGHHAVKRPHARSPPAAHHPPAWGAGTRFPSPVPSGAMEWTATSDPSGQHPEPLRVPSQPGSENDGDSACSRETRSGPAAVGARGGLPNVQLRTGSGTDLLAGSGAAAAAAAASAADAARTLQLARAATFGPSSMPAYGTAAGFGIAGANPRAASVPPQWAHLPIAALLQAAAVSGGLQGQGQAAQPQPPSPPMTHAQLFKPPFKPSSPDTSTRRAERAGKLRARRGGPVAASDAVTNGGSGTGGASGQASYDNFNLPPQQADSGGRGKSAGAQGDGAAATGNNAKADQRSSTPPSGDAGSDGSQDSMLVKNGFGDGDSDKAEGYGSNPTGNGSSDGLGNSNGSGNGNGSSDAADDARKPSPPAPSGDGTSKAPGKLMPGDRAPDPEQCAGKAHAHAHAQAHPHAHTPGETQQASFQLAALQGLTNAAGMMPPSSAAVAAASANMSGWGPNLQGLGTQQATTSSLLMAAKGQGLNTAGLSPAALVALPAANSPAWSAVAAQMRRAGSAGGVPGLGPLFPSGHAVAAQQQAILEQLQAQRQASAQYQHPIDGPHPRPGQAKAHSAFEPASQLTPPPPFREPGPAKATASGRSSGSDGARTPKDGRSGGGGGGNNGCSPRDGGAINNGDQALLERMPSRPRASRASPTGPPLKIVAAASPATAGKGDGGGIVPLAAKDCDIAGGSGASGRSSNASAASGFQPYRAESSSLQKRTVSGTRLDVPPRKRLHLCNVDPVSTVN